MTDSTQHPGGGDAPTGGGHTWNDGPWHDAQRKRVRVYVISVVLAGGMMIALVGGALWYRSWHDRAFASLPDLGSGRLVELAMLLPIAVFAITILMIVRRLRVERRILRDVPAHDGLLCPRCLAVLDRRGDGGACRACSRDWTVEEARAFWDAYPHQASIAPARRNEPVVKGRSALPGSRLPWLLLQIQRRPLYGVLYMIAIWIALLFATVAITGGPLLSAAASTFWMFLFGIGICVASHGTKRRVGDGVHCIRCDYERAPGAPDDACPECGLKWGRRGGTIRGRTVRSTPRILAGIALIALALPLGPLMQLSGSKLMTTSMLISHVTTSRTFTIDEWATLKTRTLTPEQEIELAEGLLDRRLRESYSDPDADTWLQAAIARGGLPPDLVARFHEDLVTDVTLTASVVERTRLLQVTLEMRAITHTSPVELLYIVPERLDLDGTPIALLQPLEVIHVAGLPRRDGARYSCAVAEPARDDIAAIATGGPATLKLAFWAVLFPPSRPAVSLDADGRLVVPTATWTKRFEVETTVE